MLFIVLGGGGGNGGFLERYSMDGMVVHEDLCLFFQNLYPWVLFSIATRYVLVIVICTGEFPPTSIINWEQTCILGINVKIQSNISTTLCLALTSYTLNVPQPVPFDI